MRTVVQQHQAASDPAEVILATLAGLLTEIATSPTIPATLRYRSASAREQLLSIGAAFQLQTHRLDSRINLVPDAATILGPDGRILEANVAACESFGLPHDVLLNLSIFDLNPQISPDRFERLMREHAKGDFFAFETVHKRGDGTQFPVDLHAMVFEQDGELRFAAVARDISAQQNFERRTLESEARCRHLLDVLDAGVLVQDTQMTILFANPCACRILGGNEATSWLGRRIPAQWEFVDEHGLPVQVENLPMQRALRERDSVSNTIVGLFDPQLNRHLWLNITATPQTRPDEPDPFQVISTLTDVSALKRDQHLFERAQQLTGMGAWEWDPTRQTMYWSPALYHLLDREGQIAWHLHDLVEPVVRPDQPRVNAALRAMLSEGGSFDLECRMHAGRNGLRWMRLIGEGLRRGNHSYRVAGTLQDITREKQPVSASASPPGTGVPAKIA